MIIQIVNKLFILIFSLSKIFLTYLIIFHKKKIRKDKNIPPYSLYYYFEFEKKDN